MKCTAEIIGVWISKSSPSLENADGHNFKRENEIVREGT